MHLPKRAVAIHQGFENAKGGSLEGLLVAVCWKFMMKKMIRDFEIQIIFECWMRDVERGRHQALTEARKSWQAAFHIVGQFRVIEGALEGRESGKMQRCT